MIIITDLPVQEITKLKKYKDLKAAIFLFFSFWAGLWLNFVELAIMPIIQVSWQVVFLTKIYTPKIGPKGQMTLPKEIRAALELEEGDRVLLKVEPDGKVILEKAIIISASKKNQFRYSTES